MCLFLLASQVVELCCLSVLWNFSDSLLCNSTNILDSSVLRHLVELSLGECEKCFTFESFISWDLLGDKAFLCSLYLNCFSILCKCDVIERRPKLTKLKCLLQIMLCANGTLTHFNALLGRIRKGKKTLMVLANDDILFKNKTTDLYPPLIC